MWVSIYEGHGNKHRPIAKDKAEMEASLAVNGPLFEHADDDIKEMFKGANNVNNSRLLSVKISGLIS